MKLVPVKGGWFASSGEGWAAFGKTEAAAEEAYRLAQLKHAQIDARARARVKA